MIRAAQVFVFCILAPVHVAVAQLPHIIGSWKLDSEASIYPGPLPQSQVRTYLPLDDGFLLGIAVTIDALGNASFLQFAARPDGLDYPEYDPFGLAQLQISGTVTKSTYSESYRDEYTVEWADKSDGVTYASGIRQVSENGETLTIEFEMQDSDGEYQEFKLVYERQRAVTKFVSRPKMRWN